jgi:hypothetical protein
MTTVSGGCAPPAAAVPCLSSPMCWGLAEEEWEAPEPELVVEDAEATIGLSTPRESSLRLEEKSEARHVKKMT